ncbi:MAG: bifunctional (p)ppGpp synthetase/guanosine-3',5'-bis(diphosphate) 3'-pyrophosphohydrolase [Armatimonadota bacterium]
MNIRTITSKVKEYYPEANIDLIKSAYHYACLFHENQIRASGEPYIEHPFSVANILAELKMDEVTIAASLLHDIVEDTPATLNEVREMFGNDVANLVDGVTKLSAMSVSKEDLEREPGIKKKRVFKEENRAKNLRKIFMAMADDIRVILIKIADRLHNMRTLGSLPSTKRKIISKETLDIFAPIASRLGLWHIKWELEDLSFHYLEPEMYEELEDKLASKRAEREKVIHGVCNTVKKKLEESDIHVKIEGRPKHLYSIYLKMKNKGIEFKEVYDLFAVRIIVGTIEECYGSLGIIHSLWMPLMDRIKDYIAMPKPNNYRSLHTTVYGPGSQPLEVQIRTQEMHEVNEYGIAAHWAYKEGGHNLALSKEILPLINILLDSQEGATTARDYIKNLKDDLLKTQIFVFTPKSDVIDLPMGATPIDFAYRIHTDIGHKCVGAKVNTKIVPLDYQLQTGDIIEIITAKNSGPNLDWLKICKTSHAKTKIKQWIKKEKREDNIALGRELLQKELKKQRLEKILDSDDIIKKISKGLKFTSLDDFYAALGYGEVNLSTVLMRFKDELPKEEIEKMISAPKTKKRRRKYGDAVIVPGLENVLVRFSKCCSPVYGDKIKGYVTLGKGISVHRENCINLKSLASQKERLVEIKWNPDFKGVFAGIEIEIEAWDRSGLLSDIMSVLNERKISADSCLAVAKKERAQIKICLEVKNVKELKGIMDEIKKQKDVIDVRRVTHIK